MHSFPEKGSRDFALLLLIDDESIDQSTTTNIIKDITDLS